MEKSIFSWFGFFMPIQKRLELIKKAGFDGVSLWWEDETSPEIIKKEDMPKMAVDNGLFVEYIHAPYSDVNNLWTRDEKVREKTLERYFGYIEDCHRHGIGILVMHCSDKENNGLDIDAGIESFKYLAEKAKIADVRIAIENTRDASLVDMLLEELKLPNLGLCYDSSHDWLTGQTKGQLFEKWAERTFTTHLSDNDELKDRHWLPGDGHVDWKLLREIHTKSNLCSLSIEVTGSCEPFENPEDFLSAAYERLEGIVGGL